MSSPFECQPSSDQSGQVYTPNIPDSYFNHQNLAQIIARNTSNLITTKQFVTYIFTIPPEPAGCSGSVVAIQYCYRTNDTQVRFMSEGKIFEFLHLTQLDELQFEVNSSIQITSVANASICTDIINHDDIQQVCCNTTTLSAADVFQIPSSGYAFGVTSRAYQPLAFDETHMEYLTEQFQTYLLTAFPIPSGLNFSVSRNNQVNESLPLIRLIIGKYSCDKIFFWLKCSCISS